MECGFGHRSYYFGFPNSEQNLLAYRTLLIDCSLGHHQLSPLTLYHWPQNCDSFFPVSYHENVTKPTRGIICVGNLDNKMQLDTQQLSPRKLVSVVSNFSKSYLPDRLYGLLLTITFIFTVSKNPISSAFRNTHKRRLSDVNPSRSFSLHRIVTVYFQFHIMKMLPNQQGE
jgi:hypothetical protein